MITHLEQHNFYQSNKTKQLFPKLYQTIPKCFFPEWDTLWFTTVLFFILRLPPSLAVSGWQRSTQRAPGPHLSGCGDGRCQPHHPGPVSNRRCPQRHQDGVPGGRMNCTGLGRRKRTRGEGKGGVEKVGNRWGLKKDLKKRAKWYYFLVKLLNLPTVPSLSASLLYSPRPTMSM